MSDNFSGQNAISSTTIIQVEMAQLDFVMGQYSTIPGNAPNAYGNYVSIWQSSSPSIPWNTPALATQMIQSNTPNGSFDFFGLQLAGNSYVIGYSVGPVMTGNAQPNGNVCATVFFQGENISGGFSPAITIQSIMPTTLVFGFSLPDGVTPQNNGAWIGVWSSGSPSYTQAPLASVAISSNNSGGNVGVTNINIMRGTSYTAALFMSGYSGSAGSNRQTAMAASVTFTV